LRNEEKMPYTLRNFVLLNKGINGILLIDLLSGSTLSLDKNEAEVYEKIVTGS
jgi:hypothetical protein